MIAQATEAFELVNDLVKAFPWVGTDDPIAGSEAVDLICAIVERAQILKAKIDEFRKEQEDLAAYREAAYLKQREGHMEVDSDAVVSKGDDPGAYVEAWIWIDDEDAGIDPNACGVCDETEGVESTYCGSFCEECLREHVEECEVCAKDFG